LTAAPRHTPYDGSSKPFSIGLRPLDLAEWIEVGDDLDIYLAEKRRLYATVSDKVFVEEPDTREAQREVLDLIEAHLARHHPELLGRSKVSAGSNSAEVGGEARNDKAQNRDDADAPPLRTASLLVQEDLILMRRGEDGWRLAAGSLCFPSSWSLVEKFGRPLHEIHAPVPGFGGGTRNADLISRMFDSLQGQAVLRWNWSLQAGNDLYLPFSHQERVDRATNRPSRFSTDEIAAQAFIRVERQTLRKLPVSGDILFTIRIHLDPLSVLEKHPDRQRLASSFADQLAALDGAQLDYKGLTSDRDRLAAVMLGLAQR
jgi:dimethylamine monooxygenase subunit A